MMAYSFFIVHDSSSQTSNQLMGDIERLNSQLVDAKKLAFAFKNERAQQLLVQAEQLRNTAVKALNNKNVLVAKRNIDHAVVKVKEAVNVVIDGPVKRLRSRLEQLLRKADQEVLGRHHKEAERVLRQAKKNRDAAVQAFFNQKYLKSLEHYRVAENLAKRALDLVKSSNNPTLDKILEEKQRFEILRDRARKLVNKSANTSTKQIFDQAIKLYQSAEKAVKNSNLQLAKKFYNQSILLLLRAMDIAKDESPEAINQVEVALFRLRELIDNSKEIIQKANFPRAKPPFERAKRFAREAEVAARNGNNQVALRKIDLAEKMINRARSISRNRAAPDVSNRIFQEIENAKSDISETEMKLTADSPQDASVLINMAKSTISRAEQSANAGFTRFALEEILAAQRFLTKAESILTERETSTISRERIQQKLNQLDVVISQSESKIALSNQEWNKRLFQGTKDVRKFVVDSIQKGNYRAAEEGIKVAFELINKSLKDIPGN